MARRNDLAKTWWSQQWIGALENRALRDPNRLPRGRTYARRGAVLQLVVEEGQITARVAGSRGQPYRVTIGIRRFRPEEWQALFAVIGSQVGFTADLLAGTVPPELVADAAQRGVELLPVAGDLSMNCSCPDWAVPCKHLAAVCYMTASSLDDDPFNILLLRGQSRDQVEQQLRADRAAIAAPEVSEQRSAELASTLWANRRLSATSGVGPRGTQDDPLADASVGASVAGPVGADAARPVDASIAIFASIGRASTTTQTDDHATRRFATRSHGTAPASADLANVARKWMSIGADPGGELTADVVDAAQRASLTLIDGQPTFATLDVFADAARRGANADSPPAHRAVIARRLDTTLRGFDALSASWQTAGADGVRVASVLNALPATEWPAIDPILAEVARQILSDSGLKVRVNPSWLAVAGPKLRIVGDPAGATGAAAASGDRTAKPADTWFAVRKQGRYWHVLGAAPLDEISELSDLVV